jgi:hypothetical protein
MFQMPKPQAPGRYMLSVDGDIKVVKVIDMNGELYMVRHRWFLFTTAVPINNVEGRWIDTDVRSSH